MKMKNYNFQIFKKVVKFDILSAVDLQVKGYAIPFVSPKCLAHFYTFSALLSLFDFRF